MNNCVLKYSPQFSRFYTRIRPQLSPFTTLYDPTVPRAARAAVSITSRGVRYLRLRTRRVPVSDAALLAHEILHLKQHDLHYPGCPDLNDHAAACSLNSAFLDVLVNHELVRYGFRIASARIEQAAALLRQLRHFDPPSDVDTRAPWIATCLASVVAGARLRRWSRNRSRAVCAPAVSRCRALRGAHPRRSGGTGLAHAGRPAGRARHLPADVADRRDPPAECGQGKQRAMIGAKRKGSRNERRSKTLLESAGYCVTRAAASLGMWDLVAVGPTDFVLVQCKSNRPPSPAEREALALFACPPNCKRLVHVWRDRQRHPDVILL